MGAAGAQAASVAASRPRRAALCGEQSPRWPGGGSSPVSVPARTRWCKGEKAKSVPTSASQFLQPPPCVLSAEQDGHCCEGGEALEHAAQGGCGCLNPGCVQGFEKPSLVGCAPARGTGFGTG